jgi:hypothetical protein
MIFLWIITKSTYLTKLKKNETHAITILYTIFLKVDLYFYWISNEKRIIQNLISWTISLKIMKPPWCTYDEHELSPISLQLNCWSFIEFLVKKILIIQ